MQYDTLYYYLGQNYGINDTILSRQQTALGIQYTIKEWRLNLSQRQVYSTGVTSLYVPPGYLVDTLLMPEEYSSSVGYTRVYVYVEPLRVNSFPCGPANDTVWEVCRQGGRGLTLLENGLSAHSFYRQVLGMTYYHFGSVGEGQHWDKELLFFSRNGISCGFPTDINRLLGNKEVTITSFHLYPQPAGNTVYLEAPGLRYPATIRIQNLQGQVLSQQQITTAGKSISTANLPAGLYLLSVTDAGGNSGVEKLIIEAN